MKKLLLIAALIGLAGCDMPEPPQQAETLQGGYYACSTEQTLDKLTGFIVNNDRRMIEYFVEQNVCFMLSGGQEYSILYSGWATVKVRVWHDDGFIDFWAPIEATQTRTTGNQNE